MSEAEPEQAIRIAKAREWAVQAYTAQRAGATSAATVLRGMAFAELAAVVEYCKTYKEHYDAPGHPHTLALVAEVRGTLDRERMPVASDASDHATKLRIIAEEWVQLGDLYADMTMKKCGQVVLASLEDTET